MLGHELTTLELAQQLAIAARAAADDDAAAVAVLDVMHATSSWFTRVSEDERGCTIEQHYEQLELFK